MLDRSFRNQLKEKKFTMLVKTRDANDARYYTLANGKFSSKRSDYAGADISIEWDNSQSAVSTLFTRSPKVLIKGLSDALTSDRLRIEFNIERTMWFVSMVKEMVSIYMNLRIFKRT
ncbi:MAG: hypothetical protein GY864_09595 [Desulfobacterales bacterium]|nr:hypothetical protein [Desulfobacterales bacterium]